ncbi:DUF4105 domain-containing protein [Stagnimonas aquatica]|uniref:DUF4105 domain-containing protein n=1 Tax=Stagnimonas aquatica TaxID=2689987 RepID=A0A3N0VH21_9GAMM|nr:DUF4105 domain-containing protein [Stagnimonas aquatica]ROH91960.1 DUF4105 domain-containing protein [Stagnimonas aquatica]
MSALRHWLAASLLALLAWLPAAQAQAEPASAPAPRISLLSFAPGPVYWQRFGHNALMVEPGDGSATAVYNYGIFDFFQKNFFLNFARGHMLYRLAAIPVPNTLAEYAAEGRWVYVQELALSETQARQLAAFLADNALPQNAEYRYDYFLSNCSTRVRDALDQTLGGALKQAWSGQPSGSSFRREATRLMSPVPALMLGMDYILGPAADRPISLWEQAFVPEVLMRAVRAVRVDGQPLVAREGYWLPPAGGPEAPEQAFGYTLPALLLGALLATALVLLHRQRRRPAARGAYLVLALLPSLLSGLGGVVLLAAWTLTDHWAMWANHNLLLFSPLSLLLIPSLAGSARAQWRPGRTQRLLAALIAFGALLSLPLQLLPGAQQQLPWIAFWLPVHAVLAWNLRQSGRAPPVATR